MLHIKSFLSALAAAGCLALAPATAFCQNVPTQKSLPRFPLYTYGLTWRDIDRDTQPLDRVLDDLGALNINMLFTGVPNSPERLRQLVTEAGARNIQVVWIANTTQTIPLNKVAADTLVVRDSAGNPGTYWGQAVVPFNTQNQVDFGVDKLKRFIPADLPIAGVVLDDEPGLHMGKDGIASYDAASAAQFKKKFGIDPPHTNVARRTPPSIIPPTDPWYAWSRFRCDILRDYRTTLQQSLEKQNALPFTAEQFNGGAVVDLGVDWETSHVGQRIITWHQYPFRHPPLVMAYNFDLVHMQNIAHDQQVPIWSMGGTFNFWKPFVSVANWREQCWLLLASGTRGLGFFLYNQAAEEGHAWDIDKNPAMKEAVRGVYAQVERMAPVLTAAKRDRADIAVLHSFTSAAFQCADLGTQWAQWHHGEQAFYSLMRAHLPIEMIGERAIADGKLRNYKALILVNVTHLPADVAKALAAFQQAGGIVYADDETTVPIPGLTRLGLSFADWQNSFWLKGGYEVRDRRKIHPITIAQAAKLRRTLAWTKPWYDVDNPELIIRVLDHHGDKLMFVINDSLEWEFSEPLVTPKSLKGTVTIRGDWQISQLDGDQPVSAQSAEGLTRVAVDIEPGGAAVWRLRQR